MSERPLLPRQPIVQSGLSVSPEFFKKLRSICWVITLVSSIIGVCIVGLVCIHPELSAIQQTSGFALGLCFAIIPYCIARAVSELAQPR